jgi:hypothetical protein
MDVLKSAGELFEVIGARPLYYPGLNALGPQTVYLMGCRSFDQFCCTWRSIVDPMTFCLFCPTELMRRKRNPLSHTGGWMLLTNEFQRRDSEQMLLIVPKLHIVDASGLTAGDWQEIGIHVGVCRERYGFTGGGLMMRDGDPRDHAGTIEHLHVNAIRPIREGGMSIPLAKNIEGSYGHREDYERLHDFLLGIVAHGGMRWLFSPEGIEETQPKIMEV